MISKTGYAITSQIGYKFEVQKVKKKIWYFLKINLHIIISNATPISQIDPQEVYDTEGLIFVTVRLY